MDKSQFEARLTVVETFEAAHRLTSKQAGKCLNTHGHTYKVKAVVKGVVSPEPESWVMNFRDLRHYLQEILKDYDHRLLNDVIYVPPTAENLARTIYIRLGCVLGKNNPEVSLQEISVREGLGGEATVGITVETS